MSRGIYRKVYVKCEACNGTQRQICVGYEINGMKYPAIANKCPCCNDGYTPTYIAIKEAQDEGN
jgi:hypothetical protein